jgi:hypothetical protein
VFYSHLEFRTTDKLQKPSGSDSYTKSVAWVLERTMPTERPPLVGEVSAKFCGKSDGSLQLYSQFSTPVLSVIHHRKYLYNLQVSKRVRIIWCWTTASRSHAATLRLSTSCDLHHTFTKPRHVMTGEGGRVEWLLCVAVRTTRLLFPPSPRYCCGLQRRHHNHNHHHNNAISTLLHTASTSSRCMIILCQSTCICIV